MGYIQEMRALIGTRPLLLPVAAVLICQQEQLLFQLRRDNRCWGLIGGGMEIGESFEQTARREALEETGLTLGALELLGVYSGPELLFTYPHGDVVALVAAVYLASEFNGTLRPDPDEASDLAFFAFSALPQPLNPPDQWLLAQLAENLQNRW